MTISESILSGKEAAQPRSTLSWLPKTGEVLGVTIMSFFPKQVLVAKYSGDSTQGILRGHCKWHAAQGSLIEAGFSGLLHVSPVPGSRSGNWSVTLGGSLPCGCSRMEDRKVHGCEAAAWQNWGLVSSCYTVTEIVKLFQRPLNPVCVFCVFMTDSDELD